MIEKLQRIAKEIRASQAKMLLEKSITPLFRPHVGERNWKRFLDSFEEEITYLVEETFFSDIVPDFEVIKEDEGWAELSSSHWDPQEVEDFEISYEYASEFQVIFISKKSILDYYRSMKSFFREFLDLKAAQNLWTHIFYDKESAKYFHLFLVNIANNHGKDPFTIQEAKFQMDLNEVVNEGDELNVDWSSWDKIDHDIKITCDVSRKDITVTYDYTFYLSPQSFDFSLSE